MPTDMVSLTVSTGLGVSVFAGILSGLVYVLTQGIKQRKQYVFSKIFLRNFFFLYYYSTETQKQ